MSDTNNQQERQTVDVHWLAGLWEGEGCITIGSGSSNRLYPLATIVNTDKVLIEEVHQVLQGLGIGHHIQHRTGLKARHKDRYIITIAGMKRVKIFIEKIGLVM